MPDPLLYLKSAGMAAMVSALCVLILAARQGRDHPPRLTVACLVACGLGIAAGCWLLGWRAGWPTNALDRFVKLVIPGCLLVELLTARLSGRPARRWLVRTAWIATVPPTLLFGSVHVVEGHAGGMGMTPAVLYVASGLMLAATWFPLDWLNDRLSAQMPLMAALGSAIFCAGVAVMLGGYINGGAVVCPLVGALAGAAVTSRAVTPSLPTALIALGVVELYGVVFVGTFFGRLDLGPALALILSPLVCWVSEFPGVRQWRPWVKAALQLALVAISLALVVGLAKRDFDVRMKQSRMACLPPNNRSRYDLPHDFGQVDRRRGRCVAVLLFGCGRTVREDHAIERRRWLRNRLLFGDVDRLDGRSVAGDLSLVRTWL
jgi:hypothetical protein